VIAAGIAIAREAGAIIMDLDGANHGLESRATVVVSPGITDQLPDILRVAAKCTSPVM
jgi:myo-inositol-1(or 4)-monophosphatase